MDSELLQLISPQETRIMGILNITEDSFSDGGQWLDPQAAQRHGKDMVSQGASIIDIGAESTRPGAIRVAEDVEKKRVVSATQALKTSGAALSIDTTRATVAQAGIEAGACIINDVSGGTLDSRLPHVVADAQCLYVVQHWRGWLGGKKKSANANTNGANAQQPDSDTSHYEHGVVNDVYEELMHQVDAVLAAGVAPEQIIIDPGLGFSKPSPELNMPLLANLQHFSQTGYPVLIGASRKRFLSALVSSGNNESTNYEAEDIATAVISALVDSEGAWAVRVHNVSATANALTIARSWKNAMKNQEGK